MIADSGWEALLEQNPVLIDCRNVDELQKGSIEGAMHLPCRMSDDPAAVVAANAEKLPGNKAQPILVFCGVGGRASRLKLALVDAGYVNTKNAGAYSTVKSKLAGEST